MIQAIEANLWEFGAYLGQSSQVDFHDHKDMLWYSTRIAYPMLNGVFRTQLSPHETGTRIEETVEYFRSRKLPMTWWIGPSTYPDDLGHHLETRGLIPFEHIHGMAIHLAELEKEIESSRIDITIKRVEDFETLKEWTLPYGVAFGFPTSTANALCDLYASLGLGQNYPLHHYVGYSKGSPVACSSMFVGASSAGIYNVGTIPSERNHGIATAVTLEALFHAYNMGAQIGVLHSSKLGLNLYRKIGFKEFCKIRSYVWLPRGSASPQ